MPVAEIRAQLARIPQEVGRREALKRFHVLLVCATVMKADPLNYQRATRKACDDFVRFLVAPESNRTGANIER